MSSSDWRRWCAESQRGECLDAQCARADRLPRGPLRERDRLFAVAARERGVGPVDPPFLLHHEDEDQRESEQRAREYAADGSGRRDGFHGTRS